MCVVLYFCISHYWLATPACIYFVVNYLDSLNYIHLEMKYQYLTTVICK